VAVLKAGNRAEGQEQVDAISGATITSTGVSTMLNEELVNHYAEFLNERMNELTNEGKEEDHVESED
jgi:Na+-transporting NADH:ubiquinone oxidoreductase subunit C